MTEGMILETRLLLPGFEEIFAFSLCSQLACFLNTLCFIPISHLLLPAICSPSQFAFCIYSFIWAFIRFVTCVVMFSETSANSYSSVSCFCGNYDKSWVGIQRYLMVVRGYTYYERSTVVVLEFLDLMKLASIAFSIIRYASFIFIFQIHH